MENNILTAKEWTIEHSVENRTYIEANRLSTWDAECYKMERYADYRTKMLEGKVLEFRHMLEKQSINHATKLYKDWFKTDQIENNIVLESYISCVKEDMLLKDYDKHFGIEIKTEGKIN